MDVVHTQKSILTTHPEVRGQRGENSFLTATPTNSLVLFSATPTTQRNLAQEQWNRFREGPEETTVAAGIRTSLQQIATPLTPSDVTSITSQLAHSLNEVCFKLIILT